MSGVNGTPDPLRSRCSKIEGCDPIGYYLICKCLHSEKKNLRLVQEICFAEYMNEFVFQKLTFDQVGVSVIFANV